MASNVTIPATGTGTATPVVSTDQVSADSSQVQNVQLATVSAGVLSRVSASAPLQVAIVGTVPISGAPTTVTANLGTIGGAATQTTLAAVLSALGTPLQAGGSVAVTSSALPTGAATQTTLASILTNLGTPLQAGGTVTANIGTSGSLALDATLTGGTQKTRISDALGNATNSAGSGFLKVTDEPRQIFYDPFDVALDTTNVWTSTQGSSGVAAAVATGVLSMGTGTTANGFSKLTSIPTFKPPIPGWVVYSDAIALPDGAAPTANSYRFWGAGTTPGTPTATAPVTDGYGFEMTTAGHLCCVVWAGGVRTLIADLFGGAQPTNTAYHRYIIQIRTDKTYFYIDTIDSAGLVATTSFQSTQQQILPKLFLAVGGSTPPASNTQITCTGAVVSDTGKNATQLADGTFPWRKAKVDSSGNLLVSGSFAAATDSSTTGSFTAASQTVALTGLNGVSTAIVDISGTFTGFTGIIEGSVDGLNYFNVPLFTSTTTTTVFPATISTAGDFFIQAAGMQAVRARSTAVTSGTVVVAIRASAAAFTARNVNVANPVTITPPASGHGTAATAMRVELPTDGTGVVGLNAGANIVGKVGIDQTTPGTTNLVATELTTGLTTFSNTALTSTAVAVKASAGKLHGYILHNPSAATTFIQVWNIAVGSVTVGTTAPTYVIPIPSGASANVSWEKGVTHSTAITVAATTTATGSTGPATAAVVALFYA